MTMNNANTKRTATGKRGCTCPVDEDVVSERAPLDYIHRDDFAHKPVKTWAELKRSGWVAKRVMMTKKEVVKRFGKEFADIPVEHMPEGWAEDSDENETTRLVAMAEVWEIWDASGPHGSLDMPQLQGQGA